MNIPVDSWYDAIFKRHSQRKFNGEPLDDKTLSEIERVCDEFQPFEGVRSFLIRKPKTEVFKGVVGSYGKIKDSQHYIAFIADTSIPNVDTYLGYMGEGIILDATSKGFSTCWVSGFFRPERAEREIDLHSNERVLAVTPIGYPLSDPKTSLISTFLGAHKRKGLDQLVIAQDVELNYWMQKGLEAARLAPSAANRQPWRFRISENSITIQVARPKLQPFNSKKLDCGIAMLHLELGIRKSGRSGKWRILEKPEVARFEIE